MVALRPCDREDFAIAIICALPLEYNAVALLFDEFWDRNGILGANWVARFIKRYPEIKTKRGRRQESNRFDSCTPKVVNWYFDIREKEYGWIKPENTVNMDEGGIMSGFGLDSLVVGSAEPKKKAFLKGSQSRTWTLFIEAITANGHALKPGIIFKGKKLQL
ncbi:DDE superfamily endonuclease, CENP-B-like protein, partial [Metarhizium majus ARSEF 297]